MGSRTMYALVHRWDHLSSGTAIRAYWTREAAEDAVNPFLPFIAGHIEVVEVTVAGGPPAVRPAG